MVVVQDGAAIRPPVQRAPPVVGQPADASTCGEQRRSAHRNSGEFVAHIRCSQSPVFPVAVPALRSDAARHRQLQLLACIDESRVQRQDLLGTKVRRDRQMERVAAAKASGKALDVLAGEAEIANRRISKLRESLTILSNSASTARAPASVRRFILTSRATTLASSRAVQWLMYRLPAGSLPT